MTGYWMLLVVVGIALAAVVVYLVTSVTPDRGRQDTNRIPEPPPESNESEER